MRLSHPDKNPLRTKLLWLNHKPYCGSFLFYFISTIYYVVLNCSPQQTIQNRVQPTGIYVQDCKRSCHPNVALSSGNEPYPHEVRAGEQQRKLGAQAPPQTSPGPQCRPPPAHAIHTQRCSQPKPDSCVPCNLAPLIKGGYIPIGCLKQLPEGGVNSSLLDLLPRPATMGNSIHHFA
jgi:hypothetical protein